jgi:D-alanyl-D-alanine carboxypeptidase (penicillin-binding protein 5/6)
MSKIIRALFYWAACALTSLALVFGAGAARAVDVTSQAAVLMDAETGQIIFEKQGERLMFPASATKIMTALLVAESAGESGMDEMLEISESAVNIEEWNSSNMALVPGELLKLDDLMYGLMLRSANDAANALAEHVAGTQSDFAARMTERAWLIGANSTSFSNAHGLHQPGHYTTARDLALITREAIKNPVFMNYFGATTHRIPPTNKLEEERVYANYQYMLLEESPYYDPRVLGGKVGYTTEARHTMSTAATRGGTTLVCVVMSSRDRLDKFKDTALLLDFGFNEFRRVTVPVGDIPRLDSDILKDGAAAGKVSFSPEKDFTALLHVSVPENEIKSSLTNEGPFEYGDNIEAFVEFTAPQQNSAVPAGLGRLRLTADVQAFAPVPAAPEEAYAPPRWLIPVAIAGVAAATATAVFVAKKIEQSRRRKRRLLRIERLQRERQVVVRK